MINVLYIVAGDLSFDEMLFLDTFMNQLASQEVRNCLLTPKLPLSHTTIQNRNTQLEIGTREFTRESWDKLLKTFQPHAIILADPAVLLTEDAQEMTYFDPAWLAQLPCPLAVLDFRANLQHNSDGALALPQYADESQATALEYDFIIKVCPPHDAFVAQNPKILNWSNTDLIPALAVDAVREDTRTKLGCKPGSKVLALVFPIENLIMSAERGLAEHFRLVVDTLVHYLNQLPGKYQLFVVNMAADTTETEFDNVHLRLFSSLEQELIDSLYKAADLFLTESLTHPGLVQSAIRSIPTITIGSSVNLDANGELSAAFEGFSPYAYLKLEELKSEAPEQLYPYISYPMRTRRSFPTDRLFSERYFFYLADLFDEASFKQQLQELLHGGSLRDAYMARLEDYKQRKLGSAKEADIIVKKLVTAPPRNLF